MGTSSKTKICSFPFEIKRSPFIMVNEVKAKSQSKSLKQIEHLLNANEIELIRRARNKTKDILNHQTLQYIQEQLVLKLLLAGYF